jgi:hypothetical protein
MYPPNDRATCALAKILMDFHNGPVAPVACAEPRWQRTPDQEAILALCARMAP